MTFFSWILIGVFVIIVVLGIVVFFSAREARTEIKKTGKYPEGYFLNQWMGIGIALGLPFGIPFDNIALGIPIGMAIGVAIGVGVEKKYKDKGLIRPLTAAEQQSKKKKLAIALGLLLVGVLVGLVASFIYK